MAGTSFNGLATGIDTASLITNLMYLERAPQRVLTAKKTTLQKQVSIYQSLNSTLLTMKSRAAAMNSSDNFSGRLVSVGNSAVATVTASGAAALGSHSLQITRLAQQQVQVSQGYASDTALKFNTGELAISDGTTTYKVQVTEGENSLAGIAALINKSGIPVEFSVVKVDDGATPYQLVARGAGAKSYTVNTAGLVTPPAAGDAYALPVFGETQQAQSAQFTLDGIAMTRDSNAVSDALAGVTINLLQGTALSPGTTTFSVSDDTAGLTAKINAFVGSYNDVMNQISQQSAYDSSTKKGGPLSGDGTIRELKRQLQDTVASKVEGATGQYVLLSQVGITTNRADGTLTVDAAKLAAALKDNPASVKELFTKSSGTAGLALNQYGIAEQFNRRLEAITHPYEGGKSTSVNGLIATRINGLTNSMADIDRQVTSIENRMTSREAAYKAQFTALESMVSSLNNQGSTLLNYLSRLQ